MWDEMALHRDIFNKVRVMIGVMWGMICCARYHMYHQSDMYRMCDAYYLYTSYVITVPRMYVQMCIVCAMPTAVPDTPY